MDLSLSCPDSAELRKLADGSATPEEQAALARHLDGCPNCQAAIDQLSGARDSWSNVAKQLAEPPAAEPALADALNQLEAEAGQTMTAAEPRTDHEVKFDFLDRPEKPGQLGRLAHYDILEVVGKGGMGIVLKAYDTKLQRVAAIKVMVPELAAQATARQRFIREARAAAAVTHEHVVTIHAVEADHSPPYLVMQYVEGRSLQQRIDECGALEVKEILRIGMQAASGLAAAHAQGLVHRDIKPANILLENGVERVKITDFGLARATDDARVTRSGIVAGTPQYMSPEQANGKTVDHRADLFSLGGVLYAMCTGYAPFRASSSMAVLKKVCDETPWPIRDLNPDIPEWLVAIVDKLMAKDAKDRFQTASEVAGLLGQNLAHLQLPSPVAMPQRVEPPRPPSAPTTRPAKPSLVLPILLIVAPLILVAVSVIVIRFSFVPAVGPGEPQAGSPGLTLVPLGLVVGSLALVLGVVLLIVQLARRPAAAPKPRLDPARPGVAPAAQPRRNHAWIAVLVVAVLLFVVCPLPLLGLIGAVLWGVQLRPTASDGGPQMDIQSSIEGGNREQAANNNLRDIGKVLEGMKFEGSGNAHLLDGLDWFPEESTFCASYSFPAAPVETSDALWGIVQSMPGDPSPIADMAKSIGGGTIGRLSYAFVEDPAGKRSRHFLRLSGLWNRDLVISGLANRPGVSCRDLPNQADEKVTIVSRRNTEFAFAVVGSRDILLASYERIPDDANANDLLVREMLDCKSSSKRGLRRGPLGSDIANTPASAFLVVSGEPPQALHDALKTSLGVLPRKATISIVPGKGDGAANTFEPIEGKDDVFLSFKAAMTNKTDAESLLKSSETWSEQIVNFLGKPANLLETRRVKTECKTVGFDAEGSAQVPALVWRALVARAKATPLSGAEKTRPALHVQVLKKFDPKTDRPYQTELNYRFVSVAEDSWRIEAKQHPGLTPGGNVAFSNIRLFDLPKQNVQRSTIVLRFKMKTEKVTGPYELGNATVELLVGGLDSKIRRDTSGRANGTTNWKSFELRYECNLSAPTDLAVVVDISDTGTVWLKDIELVKIPQP
jgi:serine/threonine protein kinase